MRRFLLPAVGLVIFVGTFGTARVLLAGELQTSLMAVAVASLAHSFDADLEQPETLRTELVKGHVRGRSATLKVVTIGSVPVEIETAKAFLIMKQDAERSGVQLSIESGFRTHEQQAELYALWRKREGNQAARPGRSNHQSGRALDLVVSSDAARKWLQAHARSYGFRATVKGEPWHWEYARSPRAAGAKRRRAKRSRHRRSFRRRASQRATRRARKARAKARRASKKRRHKRRARRRTSK